MNFLSHFYHAFPCANAYYACGTVLPDIVSNYSYRTGEIVKVHVAKLKESQHANCNQIAEGVKQHYFTDAHFHVSDFFTKNTKGIEQSIQGLPFTCFTKRLFAFSHVLLEIMLDRKLLKEQQQVCDTFYSMLQQVDLAVLEQFLIENTKAKHPGKAAEHFSTFCRRRFIYEYLENDVVSEMLNRINQRIGNPPFSASDYIHFNTLIHEIDEELYSQKFPKFLPEK